VAQKALRSNLSDLLASGGMPYGYTLSLCLPGELPVAWLEGFCQGLACLHDTFGLRLMGGDTAKGALVVVSVTALGTVGPGGRHHRAMGQGGDDLWLTGIFGENALAAFFYAHLPLGRPRPQKEIPLPWLKAHCHPELVPELMAELNLLPGVGAMMDLSDGLAADLPRLCRSSQCGAEVNLDCLPLSEAFVQQVGVQPEWAARAGETFQVLFSARPQIGAALKAAARRHGVTLTRIGHLTTATGIHWRRGDRIVPAPQPLFDHFRPESGSP
jgi:thiamine-monophosphate kinase